MHTDSVTHQRLCAVLRQQRELHAVHAAAAIVKQLYTREGSFLDAATDQHFLWSK